MADDCKRHRWAVDRTNAIEKKGPTGHPSGFYGIYEFLRCSKCDTPGPGRFAKGIGFRDPQAAWRAYNERTPGVSASTPQTTPPQTPMGGSHE